MITYLRWSRKSFKINQKILMKSTNQCFFRCIMFLSYRVTFLCNVVGKLIIHQKALYDIFYEKVVKWCKD